MSNGKEPKGFAGLASLVSDLEEKGSSPAQEAVAAGEHRPVADSDHVEATAGTSSVSAVSDEGDEEKSFSGVASDAQAEHSTGRQGGPDPDRGESERDKPEAEATSSASPAAHPEPTRAAPREPAAAHPVRASRPRASFTKWPWLVLIAIAAIYVYNTTQKQEDKAKTSSSRTPQRSVGTKTPTGVPQAPLSALEFSKPPVGRDNVLNVSQVRWCLREEILLDTLRLLPTLNAQIDDFNRQVSEYNSRCGSYRYRKGTVERARREVERHRSEIVANISSPWNRGTNRTVQEPVPIQPETEAGRSERQRETNETSSRSENQKARSDAPAAAGPSAPPSGQSGETTLAQAAPQASPSTVPSEDTPIPQTRTEHAAPSKRKGSEAPQNPQPGRANDIQGTQQGQQDDRERLNERNNSGTRAADRASGQERIAGPVEPGPAAEIDTELEAPPEPTASEQAPTQHADPTSEPRDNRNRTDDEPESPDGVTEAARTGVAQASAADQITGSAEGEPVPEHPGQSEAVDTAEPVEEPPTGRRELTEGIQRNLKALGYEPGPIDGIYGPKTKRAIEAYERDMGTIPKGDATIEIWQSLQRAIRASERPRPRDGAEQSDLRQGSERGTAPQSGTQRSRESNASHFTLGSHKNEVLRVQGTPDSLSRYDSVGTMTWQYGASSVELSTRTNEVLEWTNRGNLRVHLAPGPNATTGSRFTLGSHKDDVLRVQGTPDSISRYDTIGKMTWQYGASSVELSTRTNEVLEWTNRGDLRVHLAPGPNTTTASHFRLGSHKDDVLRVQGTPDSISRYDTIGKMTWQYGASRVEISLGTGRVLDWSNNGNLEVVD